MKRANKSKKLPLGDYVIVAVLTAIVVVTTWCITSSTNFMIFGDIITRVETDQKVVALTFDDGPLPSRTDETLATLQEKNTKATFFVIGKVAKAYPQALRNIIAAGHEVGNHSYDHSALTFLAPAMVAAQIERTDDVIRESGYSGYIPFRAPYHLKFVVLPYYLASHNRPAISRDVIPDEGDGVTKEQITNEVVSKVKPGSIVLMHPMYDHTSSTRQALGMIIDQLHAKGYKFVTISELLAYRK